MCFAAVGVTLATGTIHAAEGPLHDRRHPNPAFLALGTTFSFSVTITVTSRAYNSLDCSWNPAGGCQHRYRSVRLPPTVVLKARGSGIGASSCVGPDPSRVRRLNPTGTTIVRLENEPAQHGEDYRCPKSGHSLRRYDDSYWGDGGYAYPMIGGIPCLLPENAVLATQFHQI
jgi:hypothetical protein